MAAFFPDAAWILIGVAAGSLLAAIQRHPHRAPGLVPFGVTGLFLALVWLAIAPLPPWLCVVMGVMGGLVSVPLSVAYRPFLPADGRGKGLGVLYTAAYILITGVALAALPHWQASTPGVVIWLVAGCAGIGTVVVWWALFRESFEQVLEWIIWPIYRIRGYGPGLTALPRKGPLLILANHSTWFDPLFIGKVTPRPLTPMMTSVFYDLRLLRWWMQRIFHAIRVETSTFRREAPELQQAIAALDRGECVVIFPEGMLKRRTEQPLRQFGQGVWHVLRERPATPVVACWIEGGWGSYTSYCGGPPTVNKRPDLWRRIDVGVSEPQVLNPSLLDDQRRTRTHLMESCLDARRHLGLESLRSPESAGGEPDLEEEGQLEPSEHAF